MLFALNVVSVLTLIDAPAGSPSLLQTHTDHTQALPRAGGVRRAQTAQETERKKAEARVLDGGCGFSLVFVANQSVRGGSCQGALAQTGSSTTYLQTS